jgi:hypothetical protein
LDIKINMGILNANGKSVMSHWFDPRTGIYNFAGINKNDGIIIFNPPSSGRNNDWVLVLDITE